MLRRGGCHPPAAGLMVGCNVVVGRGVRRTSGHCSAAPFPGRDKRTVVELMFSKETLKLRGNVRGGMCPGSGERL